MDWTTVICTDPENPDPLPDDGGEVVPVAGRAVVVLRRG